MQPDHVDLDGLPSSSTVSFDTGDVELALPTSTVALVVRWAAAAFRDGPAAASASFTDPDGVDRLLGGIAEEIYGPVA